MIGYNMASGCKHECAFGLAVGDAVPEHCCFMLNIRLNWRGHSPFYNQSQYSTLVRICCIPYRFRCRVVGHVSITPVAQRQT